MQQRYTSSPRALPPAFQDDKHFATIKSDVDTCGVLYNSIEVSTTRESIYKAISHVIKSYKIKQHTTTGGLLNSARCLCMCMSVLSQPTHSTIATHPLLGLGHLGSILRLRAGLPRRSIRKHTKKPVEWHNRVPIVAFKVGVVQILRGDEWTPVIGFCKRRA